MHSHALVRLFASILGHGNFLNARTPRAGARSFTLDSLDKVRALKSGDGRTSLLEYACRAASISRDQYKEELGHVRAACQLPLLDVLRIVKEVEDGIEAVGQELALCPLSGLEEDVAADAAEAGAPSTHAATGASRGTEDEQLAIGRRFRHVMQPFYTDMQRGLTELTSCRDETRALLKKLAVWLGEDAAKANPDALLKTCADLIDFAASFATIPDADSSDETF